MNKPKIQKVKLRRETDSAKIAAYKAQGKYREDKLFYTTAKDGSFWIEVKP
jgi:hypothetical protein